MNQTYSLKFELGIALSIFALPLSWSVLHILGKNLSIITDLLMVTAMFFLLDLKRPILVIRRVEFVYILYHLIVLIYVLFCDGRSVLSELIYNGYTIVVFMLIITKCRQKKFSHLLDCFCVLGGAVIFITFIYATNYLTTWSWETRFSLAESGDPLTLSDRILTAMTAFILWKPEKFMFRVAKVFFLVMGIVGLLATGVRKTLLMLVMILIINLYYSTGKKHISKAIIKKFIKSFVVLGIATVVIVFLLNTIPTIRDNLSLQFKKLIERTFIGVYTYFNKGNTVDMSALTRVKLREQVINRWFDSDNIIQILFGHGYIETYVDIPILQIFSDLGFVLGVVYVFYSVILPIKYIVDKSGVEDSNIRLLKLMVAPTLISQFVNGVPYGYRLWLPMTYLLGLVDIRKIKSKKIIK